MRPPNFALSSAPPRRDVDSSTTTCAPLPREPSASASTPSRPPLSSHAAASPLMPPPMTTTRPTVDSAPTVRVGRHDHVGQDGHETPIVVERCGAGQGKADLRRHLGQLHVDVV